MEGHNKDRNNKIENKKNRKVSEIKSWFLENNKIEKPLARLEE